MSTLHCYECGVQHDIWKDPDTGACIYCGGQLVEGDELPPDSQELLKELIEHSIDDLANKGKKSKEQVIANISNPVYIVPKKRDGLKN